MAILLSFDSRTMLFFFGAPAACRMLLLKVRRGKCNSPEAASFPTRRRDAALTRYATRYCNHQAPHQQNQHRPAAAVSHAGRQDPDRQSQPSRQREQPAPLSRRATQSNELRVTGPLRITGSFDLCCRHARCHRCRPKVSQLRQRPQSAAPEEQHAAVSKHTHARVRIARDISLTPQQARSSLPGASPARLTTSGHTARHRSAGKTPGCKRSRDHRHRPGAAGASDDRPSSAATRHRVAPHLDP